MSDTVWAPCLHGPKGQAEVEALIRKVYGEDHAPPEPLFTETYEPERTLTATKRDGTTEPHLIKAWTRVEINPEVTEHLLWAISDLRLPSGEALKIEFHSDQWVGIRATAVMNGKEESTWVEGDDFTLALAKTLEVWQDLVVQKAGVGEIKGI